MRRWRAPLRSSPSELGAARSERARAELTDARRRKLFSRSLGESQAEIRPIEDLRFRTPMKRTPRRDERRSMTK
jgi:hypothetical protein